MQEEYLKYNQENEETMESVHALAADIGKRKRSCEESDDVPPTHAGPQRS